MNDGAFVVARFVSPDHLLPATRVLAGIPSVARWNAVEGHAHLVMRLRAGTSALPSEIRSLEGLAEFRQYDILVNGEGEKVSFDPALSYAYVFLETDPARRADLRKTIGNMDDVVFLSQLAGGCDMLAVVRGRNFEALDRIVNEKIRTLGGVLRLKVERIIDLQTL